MPGLIQTGLLVRGKTTATPTCTTMYAPTLATVGSYRTKKTTYLPGVRTPLISELQSRYNMTCKLDVANLKRLQVVPLSAIKKMKKQVTWSNPESCISGDGSHIAPKHYNTPNANKENITDGHINEIVNETDALSKRKGQDLISYNWKTVKELSKEGPVRYAPDVLYKNRFCNNVETLDRSKSDLSKIETRVEGIETLERETSMFETTSKTSSLRQNLRSQPVTFSLGKSNIYKQNSIYLDTQMHPNNKFQNNLYNHIKQAIGHVTTGPMTRPLKFERGTYRPHSKTRVSSAKKIKTKIDPQIKDEHYVYKSKLSVEAYKQLLYASTDGGEAETKKETVSKQQRRKLPSSGSPTLMNVAENTPVTPSDYSLALNYVMQSNRPGTLSTIS